MTRIEMLTKHIDPRNLSELVDQYVFGKKNTRWLRIARMVIHGQERHLSLVTAIRILRALLRKLPKNRQYMYYYDYLAVRSVPEILALAIDISQRQDIILTKRDLEPNDWKKLRPVKSIVL